MVFLGIDLGTSSVKVLAMNEQGVLLGEGNGEYPISYPRENWAEQNPEDWWLATVKAIRSLVVEAIIAPDQVVSIGFSGQMHGLVALDADNKVLRPAILWCDQRTQVQCDAIMAHFGREGLLNTVSNQALTGFTAPKLLWMKDNEPNLFNAIRHILLPKDYIRFKLTGLYATDYSDASGMLLLNVQQKKWSSKMCDFIGISEDQLPVLVESFATTGSVSDTAKQELGLSGLIHVVGGAGDQAAGAIGTGAVEEGVLSVTLGTSGVLFAPHSDFTVDQTMRLHAFAHANGHYHSMGVMLSAASCIKWWSETVNPEISLEQLLEEAKAIPTNEQMVLFLPYLMGERTPYADPNARGTFIGLSPTTTRGHLTRAILEGVAFGLKDSLQILQSLDLPIKEIRVIGGGSKNSFWLELLATIFEAPLFRIHTEQGGALGAAILAAVGAGAYNSVEEACKAIIKTEDPIDPNSSEILHYQKVYQRYQGLYQALKPWF